MTDFVEMLGADLRNSFRMAPPIAYMRASLDLLEELQGYSDWHPGGYVAALDTIGTILQKIPAQYLITWEEFQRQAKAFVDGDRRPPPMSVPLYDVIDTGRALLDVLYPFCHGQIVEHGILYELRKKLLDNQAASHGLTQYEMRKKKVPLPHERDEDPAELIRLYLKGTPFYKLLTVEIPFTIPRKTWASHGIILAPPNHGKTQLLGSLVSSFLSATNDPVGCFVLDPHGDLFTTLRSRVDPARCVILDPDDKPPPLNFLDFGNSTEAQTLQTFSYLMSSLSGGLTDKQGAIVPYLLKLLRKLKDLGSDVSIETLRLIVDEKVKRVSDSQFFPAISALPVVDQGFFHNQFYSGRMQETKDAIGWKLYAALSNDTFREMFNSKTNSFDAFKAMQERKVVLVKGSENTLGEAGAPIFLQFIVAQAMQASFRRSSLPNDEAHRPLCILIIDEAKHVFNDQTERILTECRKWNLGFLAATQLISQIPENVRTAIYGATAIKIAGPVQSNDANQLAREMYTQPDFIRAMESWERSHAEWAMWIHPAKKSMRVRCPFGVLEAMPKQSKPKIDPRYQAMMQKAKTHEAPQSEASRGDVQSPPEDDTPSVPQKKDDEDRGDKPAPGRA